MASCDNNCSSCGENCADRKDATSLLEKPNQFSNIKKVIAIVSGKGGVGKSSVTSLLATAMMKMGKKVAILDADITGPSIPKAFGINDRARGCDKGIMPAVTKGGIKLISLNMLLEHENDPVAWRGPIISGTVKQFWNEVYWGDIDCMLIDMPPGTGDVSLTVFQSIPVDGAVIVTTPQSLVTMIVEKSVRMAAMMNVPILGIVENMSYISCPDCGKRINVFGESSIKSVAEKNGIEMTATLPINPNFASLCDEGKVEDADSDALNELVEKILG